jgi:DNA topoisomerase-2
MDMETQQVTAIPVRPIEDFFDNEYKNYAIYTIESRAIPSVIDGFKPTARKVAFVADQVWKRGDEKPMKVFQLPGRVAATAFYHHGNASLEANIIGMAQDFKNSMPIFQGIGQFGSLRSPEAGAPRYVGVRFNENFRLLYKDFELVDPQFEEGEQIEPKFFLPVIPTVLLNGSAGIAVGFATNIMNRHPLDLIDACVDVLDGKDPRELRPWIKDFTGTFTRAADNQNSWVIKGRYDIKNTSTVEIFEIPPSFTYEKYEAHLDGLVEKGVLASYDDNSSDKIHYVLKFPRQTLAELQKKGKLDETLRMQERDSENLTTLDENRKLKVFERAEDIVRYFVQFRLGYYGKRKEHMIRTLESELKTLSARAQFVKAIVDKRIEVANVKRADLITSIEGLGIDKEDGGYDFLLTMPIHTLTAEKYAELLKRRDQKQKDLDKTRKTAPEQMYRSDLSELRGKLA